MNGDLPDPSVVHLIACGTSYHAALYGERLFWDAGIQSKAFLASEYAASPPPIDDTLVIGVTQSGETADTLKGLRIASERGGETLALTNMLGSTAAREADHVMYIRAGPEIGVAASKTFSSQLASLNLLYLHLASDPDPEAVSALEELPECIECVLEDPTAERLANQLLGSTAYFFIGRGFNYPVALEGALKCKEITYCHAEGFAAGELKHGPLALVNENTPVFAIITGDKELARKTRANMKEIAARGAPVVAVTDGESNIEDVAEYTVSLPTSHPRTAAIIANVQLQLFAYHTAALLDRDIDRPRHLAKSVTVE